MTTPRLGVQLASSTSQPRLGEILERARRAEDLGFHAVYVSDHVVLPTTASTEFEWNEDSRVPIDPDAVFWEPITLLAHLAAQTSRIRLGTSVLVAPYRHPVVAAKQLAAVDVMSAGRLTVGLGVGWYAEEFAAVGAPPFDRRGTVTDEIIEVYRRVWEDHPATFSGDHFSFPPVGTLPRPVQTRVPIMVGGNSPAAVRRAVRSADGWQPALLPMDVLERRLELLRREAAAQAARLQPDVALRLVTRIGAPRGEEGGWGGAVVGSVDRVREELARLAVLGVTEVILDLRTCREDEAERTLMALAPA